MKLLQQKIFGMRWQPFILHRLKPILPTCFKVLFIGNCLLAWFSVQAASYPMPEAGNNLVGAVQYVEIKDKQTLLDVARQYDLGFNEISDANPGIDPWLPRKGTRIVLPTRFVLPMAPRKGIVVNLAEMRLYYFPVPVKNKLQKVITHPIGIGRQGISTPVGEYGILMKIENPSWTMPDSAYEDLLKEGATSIRRLVPPGPDNPLGKFAMMLNNDGLLIHGTNKPFSIGMRVSRGCLRLYPEDIQSLVSVVPKGTSVSIVDQPYKFGFDNNVLFMEAHEPVTLNKQGVNLTPVVAGVVAAGIKRLSSPEWQHIVDLAGRHTGVPMAITRSDATKDVAMSKTIHKSTQ